MRIWHLFCGAIGAIALAFLASELAGQFLGNTVTNLNIYEYIIVKPHKRVELLYYVFGWLAFFSYFSFSWWIWRIKKNVILSCILFCHPLLRYFWASFVALFNVVLFLWVTPEAVEGPLKWVVFAGLAAGWSLVAAAPLYANRLERGRAQVDWASQWNPTNTNRVYSLLILLAAGQMAWTLYPFVFEELQLFGEYSTIPQHTIFWDSGKTVRDIDYIDNHRLLGRHRRYDLEKDRENSPEMPEEACVGLPWNDSVRNFMSSEERRSLYVYDERKQRLCVSDSIPVGDWIELRSLTIGDEAKSALDRWMASDAEYGRQQRARIYTSEEKQFFRVNKFMYGFQFTSMWVFHHHNFVLGPINEYVMGKPLTEIFAQYGLLNLWMVGKAASVLGGLTYQNYFKIWYSFYYLYYLMYFALLFLMLRHRGYVAAAALLAVAYLCNIDFQWLLQGSGLNLARRIFEVPVLACLYQYLRTKKTVYSYLTWFAIGLAILNNWQVGFVTWGAAIFVLLVFRLQEGGPFSKSWLIPFITGSVAGLGLLVWARRGPDPLSAYYLAGVGGLGLPAWFLTGLLVILLVAVTVVFGTFNRRQPLSYLNLFLVLYTSGLAVYSVWGGSLPHLIVLGPLFSLTIATLTVQLTREIRALRPYAGAAAIVLVAMFLPAFISGSWHQDETRAEYYGIVNSHTTYQWNFDRARFISTMDPKFFENGVSLIHRFSEEGPIFIISRYDNFLPFLAKRYSAMPYFEVSKFQLSPKETQACIDRIREAKPDYLFVDTDINRSYAPDRIHSSSVIGTAEYLAARFQVHRMMRLQEIFQTVKEDYVLVEKGLLISVYKRK